jgi:hypothetical protein
MVEHDMNLRRTFMRHSILTIALVLALATPAFASRGPAPDVSEPISLPVYLAATSTPAPWFTHGVVAGRFGGVPVVGSFMGTSAIGILTLTVQKATFAHGTYACLRKVCTFNGLLAGVRVKGFPLPLNVRGAVAVPVHLFPTHGSWLAAVTTWAKQHLTWDEQRRIVAEARSAQRVL